MYGLIGKVTAAPGRREELAQLILQGVHDMPGCLSYVIARDTEDENALWFTEVWQTKEQHEASLQLPAVQEAIRQARPLMAGFSDRHVTEPVGGHGI